MYRWASVACLVCGASHATCGQATEVTPVDLPNTERVAVDKTLKRYAVVVNGYRTHMRLTTVDAEELGGVLDEVPAEPVAEPDPEPAVEPDPDVKARRASDKARNARTK